MTVDYYSQHLLFLWSVAAGASLSLFYDLFRLIRALGLKDRFSVFFQDVVFCLVGALTYILLLFNFSSGVLRLYALIGMAAGFLLCHLTFGVLFMKCVNGIKRAVFSLFRKIKGLYGRFEEKKAARKTENNKQHRGNKPREEKGKTHDKKNKRKRNG